MTFTSIVDLYFTSVGLLGLNIIASVLVDTGIIYIPFIIVIIETLFDGMKSSRGMSDSSFTLKALEAKFTGMLVVVCLAFLPIMPYELEGTATYQRMCDVDGEVSNIENDFDEIEASNLLLDVSGYDLRVPFVINLVINLGNGVAVESVNRLPCSINITAMSMSLVQEKITDTELALDLKEFMYQCYQPARSLALQNMDMSIPWIEDVRTSDSSWPGHEALRNNEYYGNVGRGMFSKVPMAGWQSSPNNASYYKYSELDSASQGTAGFPTCYEWWDGVGSGFSGTFTANGKARGLRARLLDELNTNWQETDYASWNWFKETFDSFQDDDAKLKSAYFTEFDVEYIQNFEPKDYSSESEGVFGNVTSVVTRGAGTLGTLNAAFSSWAGASMIQLAAPIMKSALIFVLLVPFPLALIVSNFSMKFTVSYMFFFFALLMCPFLWDITMLLQQSLLEEMFQGDQSSTASIDVLSNIEGMLSVITNPNTALLVTGFTDAIFLAFPSLLIAIFTAAGMSVGASMGSVMSKGQELGSNAGKMGKAGGVGVQSKATGAASKARKGGGAVGKGKK